MTLKQLYEDFRESQIKEVLGDYLSTNLEYRIMNTFEDYVNSLYVCPKCGEINTEENMTYHKWDIGQTDEMICEGCRDNEDF